MADDQPQQQEEAIIHEKHLSSVDVAKINRHSSTFLGIVSFGLLCHAAALALTSLALENGTAREANPLFYVFTRTDFVLLGFVALVVLYIVILVIPMRPSLRLSLTVLVSSLSALDFAHDFYLLYFGHDIVQSLGIFSLDILI